MADAINAVMLAGQTAHQLMLLLGQQLATQRGLLGAEVNIRVHPACVHAHGSQTDKPRLGCVLGGCPAPLGQNQPRGLSHQRVFLLRYNTNTYLLSSRPARISVQTLS